MDMTMGFIVSETMEINFSRAVHYYLFLKHIYSIINWKHYYLFLKHLYTELLLKKLIFGMRTGAVAYIREQKYYELYMFVWSKDVTLEEILLQPDLSDLFRLVLLIKDNTTAAIDYVRGSPRQKAQSRFRIFGWLLLLKEILMTEKWKPKQKRF